MSFSEKLSSLLHWNNVVFNLILIYSISGKMVYITHMPRGGYRGVASVTSPPFPGPGNYNLYFYKIDKIKSLNLLGYDASFKAYRKGWSLRSEPSHHRDQLFRYAFKNASYLPENRSQKNWTTKNVIKPLKVHRLKLLTQWLTKIAQGMAKSPAKL